jgi:EmrB/QacA subfamily drug resistance transporter
MKLSRKRRVLVTVGIMTGSLLAAMEGTVVATAMPTVVASLGGLAIYSWVFSIYLLTSTVSMPIWGKLSDLYGRRSCFQISIAIFLLGSALSGAAQSMTQLIVFRALQGLGAGALTSLPLTIIGETYTLQERSRMQGLFSSVWGLSSIIGPLLGGFIADNFSWRWIFYINIPFGLAAAVILGIALIEPERNEARPVIDMMGAATLTGGITLLMLACLESGTGLALMNAIPLFGAFILLAVFVQVEKRAINPLLPLWLFRQKVFLASVFGNMLAGFALFGSLPFITLFAQGVLNSSATKAGIVLMPILMGWVTFSIVGARLLLRFGFRPVAIAGMTAVTIGFCILSLLNANTSKVQLYAGVGIIGMGMGLSMITLLMAVQHGSFRRQLGVVTSSTMFFRNIGGAVGAAIMGTLMSTGLMNAIVGMHAVADSRGVGADLDRIASNLNVALDPVARTAVSPIVLEFFRVALASGIHLVFLTGFIAALLALISMFLVPSNQTIKEQSGEHSFSQPQTAD